MSEVYQIISLYSVIGMAIIVAASTAFIIVFLERVGFRAEIIEHAPRFISQLFSCDFCLSFWVALVVTIIEIAATGCFSYLLIPALVAPFIRRIL